MRFNPLLRFFEFAEREPGRTAMTHSGESMNYGELALAASAIAAWIRSKGHERERRVGVLAERGLSSHLGVLGASWAAAAFVPMDPSWPEWRIARIAKDADLDCLLVDAKGRERCAASGLRPLRALRTLMLDGQGVLHPKHARPSRPSARDSESLMYILYTSGTTGSPKGVMVSVGNLCSYLEALEKIVAVKKEDRVSQFFPLTFDLSIFGLFYPFRFGASLRIVALEQLLSPVDFIRSEGVTLWFSTPTLIARAADMGMLRPGSMPSLRMSLFCGEALPARLASLWAKAAPRSRIMNLYGPTETTITCIGHLWRGARDHGKSGFVPIGRPHPGMSAALDEQTGELLLSGPQVGLGYWKDPGRTAEKFPLLRIHGQDRWYRTGDLAYRDARGRFHYTGRTDDLVKIGGHRVELAEVEAHLRTASGSNLVAALAWPWKDGLAQGIVGLYRASGRSRPEVMRRLRLRLPGYALPRRLIAVRRMPVNPQGKIDRSRLAKLISS